MYPNQDAHKLMEHFLFKPSYWKESIVQILKFGKAFKLVLATSAYEVSSEADWYQAFLCQLDSLKVTTWASTTIMKC